MSAKPTLAGRRIVLVLESLRLGGAERQALMLARALAHDEGAQVRVWGLGSGGPAAGICRGLGIEHRADVLPPLTGGGRLLMSVPPFARELSAVAPEVILAYTILPNVLCGLAASWTGAGLCVWNQRDAGISRMGRTLERLAARNVGLFVSNSRPGMTFLTEVVGVDPARISLVPNGVEVRNSPPAGACRRDDGEFRACMVANIHSNKDHETLLKAWRLVLDRWPLSDRPGRLLLAGREDETAAGLRSLAVQLGIAEEVRFLGPVDDVAGLLATVDLGVFSSRLEGCPNGVLECMAAGLAVVGTDIEGIRDVVGEDGLELLAPAGDHEAFADRILFAVGDESRRLSLGEAGRARASVQFSPGRMCSEMSGLIARGLGLDGGREPGGGGSAEGEINTSVD